MKKVIVEYGPPGQHGVTQIMGLAGPDEIAVDERMAGATRRVGLVAAAGLAYGLATGHKGALHVSLGLGAGALLMRYWGQ
ncbi:MAG: hypothetical protein Q8S00_32590 [Deltaproteobacteria bacterium]|nr:hypothetical protein [Deltaproteobacteria bacterium]